MGIDAEMFVKLSRKIEEDELRIKSYIFGSMCKYDLFLGSKERKYSNPLEIVDKIEGDGFGKGYEFNAGTGTILNIPLAGRYYGIGYEIGPLLHYIGIAQLLKHLFPDGEIYYGGDSSGIAFELFDIDYQNKLLEHAALHAHEPYNKYFSGNHFKHECPNCKVGMTQNGWKAGGKLGLFTCTGCGWVVSEKSETEIESGYDVKW